MCSWPSSDGRCHLLRMTRLSARHSCLSRESIFEKRLASMPPSTMAGDEDGSARIHGRKSGDYQRADYLDEPQLLAEDRCRTGHAGEVTTACLHGRERSSRGTRPMIRNGPRGGRFTAASTFPTSFAAAPSSSDPSRMPAGILPALLRP